MTKATYAHRSSRLTRGDIGAPNESRGVHLVPTTRSVAQIWSFSLLKGLISDGGDHNALTLKWRP